MADVRVTCITKPDVNSTHEHITHLGNAAAQWIWPREKVISSIENKSNTFYVIANQLSGAKAYIEVVREPGKAPYLRAYADSKFNDNLLSLDRCPLILISTAGMRP